MIHDAKPGCWKVWLPGGRSPVDHYASLEVTYRNGLIQCCYDSTLRAEVGPMGHYEDKNYSVTLHISENEVSSREELIRRIMDFVPRTENLPGTPPAGWHAIRLDVLPDEELSKLLSVCFR